MCEKEKEDTIKFMDFRETFYKCRNFEISHLWQRSIFLTAFLVLCFTGYGNLIKLKFSENCMTNLTFHLIALGIAIVGITFSVIWIAMGKGSKAWYEVYENAICNIENKKLSPKNKYNMGILAKNFGRNPDKDLMSYAAGAYSVSKLNILIGKVLFYIWIIILFLHCMLFCNQPELKQCFNNCPKLFFIVTIVLSGMFCFFIVFIIKEFINKHSESSAFLS
jgi:hypothetical protein